MPAENTTVTAQWLINEFTVTFLNWDNTLLATQTVPNGEIATPPANPTREGYTFVGWKNDYDSITGGLVLNARFTKNTTATGENELYFITGVVLLLAASGLSLVLLRNKSKTNRRK